MCGHREMAQSMKEHKAKLLRETRRVIVSLIEIMAQKGSRLVRNERY
jgi:hypothetical protein